ncbi:MAG: hydrogenase maturation protease [Candidatus Latescibacteria bacterium]|nr:hydrogenase maturation protease [Candidatus Latescibacterota bacterium]
MNPESGAWVLVVCLGNRLVEDDAVGGAVYDHLQGEVLPPGTRLCELGVAGIALLEQLAGEELLLVVDAVCFGSEPGSLHVLEWGDIPQAAGQAVSAHGIGLREALEVGSLLHPELMPRQVLLIGIEGRRFRELGLGMGPEVAGAVAIAAAEVKRQIVSRLGNQPIPSSATV